VARRFRLPSTGISTLRGGFHIDLDRQGALRSDAATRATPKHRCIRGEYVKWHGDNFLWFRKGTGGLLQSGAEQPKGESTDDYFKKKDALEIKSVSFGVSQAENIRAASGGAGAGKVKFEEFRWKSTWTGQRCPL